MKIECLPKAREFSYFYTGIIFIHFICYACLELVGKRKLKYLELENLYKSSQMREDVFKPQVFMNRAFTQCPEGDWRVLPINTRPSRSSLQDSATLRQFSVSAFGSM